MTLPLSKPAERTQPLVLPYAYPLDEFYVEAGMQLPLIEQVEGESLPEPYKSLLVHTHDMTSTLETFHACPIHLQIIRREERGDFYFREVVLVLDDSEAPVEFGAIKIGLSLLAPAARRQILEERFPLGHILKECGVPHASRPKAFLRLESDDFINRALKLRGSQVLYGRRNTLTDPQQRPLAEIVEILPPLKSDDARP